MIKVKDTSGEILRSFEEGRFDMERWKTYMDSFLPGVKDMCIKDMEECLSAGMSWERDYVPVLNSVSENESERTKTVKTFYTVIEGAEEKIIKRFGRSPDVDVILYLGLCNGAGWVTEVNGRRTILLGIEKIMELGWSNLDDMTGLIIHEMGHVYQSQFGILEREYGSSADRYLWQLFTEGIAMVFEQEIIGDAEYFHQDKDGWKKWCDEHLVMIADSFREDLDEMTLENQRYFGDWVFYYGHSDTGYYLGSKLVRYMMNYDSFDSIINYDIEEVRNSFNEFLKMLEYEGA